MIRSFSQIKQDLFVIITRNYKTNGFFLELGSRHPIVNNNTYLLEKYYNWTGLLIELDKQYEKLYKIYRKSPYIINDATKLDYISILKKYNFPNDIDYLQIDLDVENGSTIKTLELFDKYVFNEYKFACITFEHDKYIGDLGVKTKNKSMEIFKKHGYILYFENVSLPFNPPQFEDWYIHPSLVDMNTVNKIMTTESLKWYEIIQRI